MHEIENLVKNNQKQIFIKKTEYQKINSLIIGFQKKLGEIQKYAGKYYGEFVKIYKMVEEKDHNEGEVDGDSGEHDKDRENDSVIEVIDYAYQQSKKLCQKLIKLTT